MSRNISATVLATTLIILRTKNKKTIKELLVLKWTKFHVKLRNFSTMTLSKFLMKKTRTLTCETKLSFDLIIYHYRLSPVKVVQLNWPM